MERLTINVDELAQALDISRPKAYELAKSEGFPALRVGKRVLVPIEGLKQWMSSCGAIYNYSHASK